MTVCLCKQVKFSFFILHLSKYLVSLMFYQCKRVWEGVSCVSGESGDVTENDGFSIALVAASGIVPTNSDFCHKVDSSVE